VPLPNLKGPSLEGSELGPERHCSLASYAPGGQGEGGAHGESLWAPCRTQLLHTVRLDTLLCIQHLKFYALNKIEVYSEYTRILTKQCLHTVPYKPTCVPAQPIDACELKFAGAEPGANETVDLELSVKMQASLKKEATIDIVLSGM
jgi:hypothetical protein